MAHIGLLDLDRWAAGGRRGRGKPFPNLALMKLSAFHRARGDSVTMMPLVETDLTYVSCVFTWNAASRVNRAWLVRDSVRCGGTGFDLDGGLDAWLPTEVEHMMPDYLLYGVTDTSYGFTSRGCPRRCPWCVVPEKEGPVQAWAHVREFWEPAHPKLVLLDNNLLAAPNWRETLAFLAMRRGEVDFNQGLDIRLVTDEAAWLLARVGARKLRFSFDSWAEARAVEEGIALLGRAGVPASRLEFYVLVGFSQDAKGDFARLELLRAHGCAVFPMFYRDRQGRQHAPAPGPIPKDMRGNRDSLRKLARLKGVIP